MEGELIGNRKIRIRNKVRNRNSDFSALIFCFPAEFIILFHIVLQAKSSFMFRSNFQTSLLTGASLIKDGEKPRSYAFGPEVKSLFLQFQPILRPHTNESAAVPNEAFRFYLPFFCTVDLCCRLLGLNSARRLSLVTVLEYLGPCNMRWILIQSMAKWVGFSEASTTLA
jgi:hypothetical protein